MTEVLHKQWPSYLPGEGAAVRREAAPDHLWGEGEVGVGEGGQGGEGEVLRVTVVYEEH